MSISDTAIFPAAVLALRERIDQKLVDYCDFDSDTPPRLAEAIRYSLLAPGKRIRPLLVLTANSVCGGNAESAMPAACAVEMIHAYSLIHDDLPAMDDDEMRRGRPSCHIQFDEATAILAGDALIPLAFEVLSSDLPPQLAAECCRALGRAAGSSRLVGGQADDLASEFVEPNLELLEKIHRRKTGALLTVSLELGGIVANTTPELRGCLTEFGKHLGLAFQIVDDLLDLQGEQDKMGKRIRKDAEQGKMTYPALLGVEQSEALAQEMADRAITALEPFGKTAHPLTQIARFVVDRKQ